MRWFSGLRRRPVLPVFAFHKGFEAGGLGDPEGTVLVEPGIDGGEGLRVEAIEAMASVAILNDEMSAAEDAEMPGDGRARNGKGCGDLPGRLAAAAEKIEDGTAGRVGEGCKGRRNGMRNRTVTHNAKPYRYGSGHVKRWTIRKPGDAGGSALFL